MKRLVSAALALTMLSGTAAVAAPYDHGGQGYNGGYNNQYRGHDGNNGGAIVAGVGLLALAAILASQHHHRHYHDGWYNRDGGRYGYGNGYNQSYGNQYQGYGGYDHR